MIQVLQTLSISELINMNSQSINNFSLNRYASKIEEGHISGIRIHRLRPKNNIRMLDNNLQEMLEKLYTKYSVYIKDKYEDLLSIIGRDLTIDVLKKYFIYADEDRVRHKTNLKSAVYLLEFEITGKESTHLGDKMANTCANKGVVSEILPDELRPVAVNTQQPIDLIFNPFGVFSRMNLGQLSEGTVGKNVMYCDRYIKDQPENTIDTITWLNEKIIKHLNDPLYYNDVKNLISGMKSDPKILDEFIGSVRSTNLFVEAPQFTETNVKEILRNGVNPNETVMIKKETIKYFKQKLKIDVPFPVEDCEIPNVFCSPLYIMKLYKLTNHISNARDFGLNYRPLLLVIIVDKIL